ncbi:MAG: DUF983 domain-containing protein [Nitratireductor sp.]
MANTKTNQTKPARNLTSAMTRGFFCKCPSCGKTSIFEKSLKVKLNCEVCNEDFSHHRADDLPAYLNVFVVGHIVVAVAMILMRYELVGMWTTTVLTAVAALVASLVLMRPLKGMVVGNQWALGMHGFEKGKQEAERLN